MPLDLKLFYGFVAMLVTGMIALFLLWPPGNADFATLEEPNLRRLGAFMLTDQMGRAVTDVEVAGRFLVVNFVHTSCSISCLQVNRQMAEVQRLTTGRGDVRLLSFTVDPRSDTPAVLLEFGKQFGADANRWSLLTGDKTALYALIENSFLKRDPIASSEPAMPGGFHDVDRIAVVDRDGQVRRYFDGMKTATPSAVVKFLDELRSASK
jgi:protein SCO1/2